MNLNTLQCFRHEVCGCFERAADALFNTADALLTETQAHSFPELSLSPFFERRWCSLYEAFEDGRIDQQRLRRVFVRSLVRPVPGEWVWLGIDATSIQRPQSRTSPDRTVVYVPNLPESSKPIGYGWQFSTVVVLPEQPSSWTAVLDQQRIRSDQTSVEVAATQLHRLAPELSCCPIVATDRWYSCAPFLLATEGLPFDKLLRLKRKRVLYQDYHDEHCFFQEQQKWYDIASAALNSGRGRGRVSERYAGLSSSSRKVFGSGAQHPQ